MKGETETDYFFEKLLILIKLTSFCKKYIEFMYRPIVNSVKILENQGVEWNYLNNEIAIFNQCKIE